MMNNLCARWGRDIKHKIHRRRLMVQILMFLAVIVFVVAVIAFLWAVNILVG